VNRFVVIGFISVLPLFVNLEFTREIECSYLPGSGTIDSLFFFSNLAPIVNLGKQV